MNNFTKITLAIALLVCHGCALVPTLVSSTSENETASNAAQQKPNPSTLPDCLASLPKLPTAQIRKGESSKNVEAEADLLGALGKWQESLNKYSEAHTLYVEELGHGVSGVMQGDFSATMEVNRSPETPEFLFKVGIVFAQTGQHQVAIGCFTEALNQRIESPKDASVYMNRGDSYAQIGAGENARKDYQKSADLFEKYELHQEKQTALSKLNQTPNKNRLGVVVPTPQPQVIDEKYKKTCYADTLTENEGRKITESSGSLEAVADKLATTGKHKEAIRKYNEASASALNEAIANGSAEKMEDYIGNTKDFREENHVPIQKSAELNFKIGRSYVQLEKLELAIDCFDGVIKVGMLAPNDAIVHLNRGDTYARMGAKDKAKTDLQQAVVLFKKYKLPSYQKEAEKRLQDVSE